MKRCVIFGGGEITSDDFVKDKIKPDDIVICADSGYAHAKRMNIKPFAVVGDFDSWNGDEPSDCVVEKASSHKDETDTALAVRLGQKYGCGEFLMFGMTGGRLDHTLANMQQLRSLAQSGIKAALLDEREEIHMLCGEAQMVVKNRRGYSFSIFSMDEECSGVTVDNAEYTLEDAVLRGDFPLGVSNEFLNGDIRVSVKKGCAAVLLCKL